MKRVCFVGDSQIFSIIEARDAGLLEDLGVELNFFGATGPRFRKLEMVEGKIAPNGHLRDHVASITGGATEVGPEDFDAFVFYGGRLRLYQIVPIILHYWKAPDLSLSMAVVEQMIRNWMEGSRNFQFAKQFAARNSEVILAPTSFDIEGLDRETSSKYPAAFDASEAELGRIIDVIGRQCEALGLRLLMQPAASKTNVISTDPQYAVHNAIENGDGGHKNKEFGALMCRQAVDLLLSEDRVL